MNWRHKLTLTFIPLLFLMWLIMGKEEKLSTAQPIRRMASFEKMKNRQTKKMSSRSIAGIRKKIITHSEYKNRIPQSVEQSFKKDPAIKVTRGYEFLKDIAAIPKEKFTPSMGEIIQQNEHFVFFRGGENHPFSPVAISRSTNVLYPIASIVHVQNVIPSVKDGLINEGYKQYYYHPKLKFLSLTSTPAEVLKLYGQLLKKGYQAELEVLKPQHQSK